MPERAAPRVKICGLTDRGEAEACARLGAWGVGVVFAEGSRRRVSPERAREVLAGVPAGVARVGVFVDAAPDELAATARIAGLTHVQLHGRVDVAAARRATGLPVIEGVPVEGRASLDRARASAADLVLLDTHRPGTHGGTGEVFDWGVLEREPLGRPYALAGGLTPANVATAVARLRPELLDVSSGVERAPGRKDPDRVSLFLRAVAGGATDTTAGDA